MTWGWVTLTELFKLTWTSTIQSNRYGALAPIGSRRSVQVPTQRRRLRAADVAPSLTVTSRADPQPSVIGETYPVVA